MRARSFYPKIRNGHLPGKISAGIPDSLAPELLRLAEHFPVVEIRPLPPRRRSSSARFLFLKR
jgi:hypothetical protein